MNTTEQNPIEAAIAAATGVLAGLLAILATRIKPAVDIDRGWGKVDIMGHRTFEGHVVETSLGAERVLRIERFDDHGKPCGEAIVRPAMLYALDTVDEATFRELTAGRRERAEVERLCERLGFEELPVELRYPGRALEACSAAQRAEIHAWLDAIASGDRGTQVPEVLRPLVLPARAADTPPPSEDGSPAF